MHFKYSEYVCLSNVFDISNGEIASFNYQSRVLTECYLLTFGISRIRLLNLTYRNDFVSYSAFFVVFFFLQLLHEFVSEVQIIIS